MISTVFISSKCNFMAIDELQSRALRSRFAAAASLHCSLPWSIGFGWNWGRNKKKFMLVVSGTGMTLLTFDLNRTFCYSILSLWRPKTLSLLVAIHCSHLQFKFSLMNINSTLFSPTVLQFLYFVSIAMLLNLLDWKKLLTAEYVSSHYWLFKFLKCAHT